MAGSRMPDVVEAAVSALQADAALTTLLGGAKSYTHVPLNTDPPYALVMGGDEVPWAVTQVQELGTFDDGGDNGARACDVWVQCASTYRGTKQVDGIASRVLEVLTDEGTWYGIDGFSLVEFVRNSFTPPQDLYAVGVLWFQRLVIVRVLLV